MNKDAAWFVLVLLLGASLLAVMVMPEDAPNQDAVENNDANCPDGTELALNASSSTGYDCVYPDPHTLAHTHAAPQLEVTTVVDDGTTIAVSGTVTHLHPSEVQVSMVRIGLAPAETQPNALGEWALSLTTAETGTFTLELTASHPTEGTTSEVTLIDITRSTPETNETGNSTGNNTGDGGGNTTGNNTGDGGGNSTGNNTGGGDGNTTGNNTGNEGGNSTGNNTGTTQPTYDPTDLGQFWMDVFRCQAGQNITQVDDLTTAAVEQLECSVSLTMNATHITITTNGLPDHDFESTLACSQAGDCAAAQTYEWVIPRSPTNDTTGGHDATNCPEAQGAYECAPALGEVAIAINGVPFYGPEDGPGGDAVASHHGMYIEDRQAIELGVCHAHSGQGGTYHYHADANCLHWHPKEGESIADYDISAPELVANNTANGSHSAVIGVAFDGYPIYGFWGYDANMDVVEMKSSYRLKDGETGYNGIDDYEYVEGLGHLDMCNGHFGPTPEFPNGIYHYHSAMLNGEGGMGFPYFLLCYHGEAEVDAGAGGADCSGFGVTWGPGIGPPPPGCENGGGGPPPGGQLSEVQPVVAPVFSPTAMLWLLTFGLLFARSRRRG
jgi:hypothetical protein